MRRRVFEHHIKEKKKSLVGDKNPFCMFIKTKCKAFIMPTFLNQLISPMLVIIHHSVYQRNEPL